MNEIIVGVLSTALLGVIAQGVRFVNAYIASHFKPKQLEVAWDLARTAVAAAQERGGNLSWTGDMKLEYAETALMSAAKKLGLKLSPQDLSSFVHAALREMKEVQVFALPRTA